MYTRRLPGTRVMTLVIEVSLQQWLHLALTVDASFGDRDFEFEENVISRVEGVGHGLTPFTEVVVWTVAVCVCVCVHTLVHVSLLSVNKSYECSTLPPPPECT